MQSQIMLTDQPDALDQAATLLERGEVIAVPTDTVYGLICLYHHLDALETLYQVKDRPAQKALPILLWGMDQVAQVALPPLSALAQALMARFWPGPLTVVLPAQPNLPPRLTAGGSTVGVRAPNHPTLQALARRVGPLASSSANRSGHPDCHSAAQVLAQLAGRIPLILDGGVTAHGVASTVVQVLERNVTILRPGPIAIQVQQMVEESPWLTTP